MNDRPSTERPLSEAPSVGNADFQREVTKRLKRMETRLVSGFEKMGINMVDHSTGITIDHDKGIITITSLGTTVGDLMNAIGNRKAEYYVMYNGKAKCVLSTR